VVVPLGGGSSEARAGRLLGPGCAFGKLLKLIGGCKLLEGTALKGRPVKRLGGCPW